MVSPTRSITLINSRLDLIGFFTRKRLRTISIIIPTLNEVDNLHTLLSFFRNHPNYPQIEVIVVDGGSTDGTLESVSAFNEVRIFKTNASRPVQMNFGAGKAVHDLLYFVHADVRLPHTFYQDLISATDHFQAGCYRYRFDSKNPLLRINGFFSRFPMMWCRGGDQTLFINRKLFDNLGGFNEDFCVMEDFDLICRIKKVTPFHIIPKNIQVSARKYEQNSYFKVQWANLSAFRMYRKGEQPEKIRQFYKKKLGLMDY